MASPLDNVPDSILEPKKPYPVKTDVGNLGSLTNLSKDADSTGVIKFDSSDILSNIPDDIDVTPPNLIDFVRDLKTAGSPQKAIETLFNADQYKGAALTALAKSGEYPMFSPERMK
jgi:hypothetical protein